MNTRAMKIAVGGWAAFGGSHLLMSHEPVRNYLIEKCGSVSNFRTLYSGVSFATLVPMMFLFAKTPAALRGPVVLDKFHKGSLWKVTSSILRAAGAFCVTESFMTAIKNPFAMNSRLESPEPKEPRDIQRKYQVYGMQRVTRHPEVFGTILYALGSMMKARRTPADLVIWGLVPVFGIISTLHQEARLRKTKPAFYFEQTSYIPFQAIIEGRQNGSKVFLEVPPIAYAAAFCIMGHIYFWP